MKTGVSLILCLLALLTPACLNAGNVTVDARLLGDYGYRGLAYCATNSITDAESLTVAMGGCAGLWTIYSFSEDVIVYWDGYPDDTALGSVTSQYSLTIPAQTLWAMPARTDSLMVKVADASGTTSVSIVALPHGDGRQSKADK